jgi:hypothetical protein
MLRDTLVRLIYESIDEPKKRKEFLAAFAEVLEASAVALIVQDLAAPLGDFLRDSRSRASHTGTLMKTIG